MENIRISINDLTSACRVLGDVHVIAAGSMYATLECTDEMCMRLSKAKINWILD